MLFFDDIAVGYRSEIGTMTLTERDIVEFAQQWDPQPFHVDQDAAAASVFGGIVASSLHLFAVCTRLFFDHDDAIQVLAMLGKDKIRLHSPARPGDRLTYSTQCTERRPSRSKSDRGVIVLADELKNQAGEAVLTQQVTLLVACKT